MRSGTLSLRTWGRTEAELFEQKLCADRNRWDIERRQSPDYLGSARLSRIEADAKLRSMLRSQMIGRAAANV